MLIITSKRAAALVSFKPFEGNKFKWNKNHIVIMQLYKEMFFKKKAAYQQE